MKNEIEITNFVYAVLSPYLKGKINGNVYHNECRPSDSREEDAEIVFSAGTGEQIQEGFVYVNIYCADINNGSGRQVPNRGRLQAYLSWHKDILDVLNRFIDYTWTGEETPNILAEQETAEHFASFRLHFKRYNK